MELEKLRKEDFAKGRGMRCIPTLRLTKSGCIILSRGAVNLLGLYDKSKKQYFGVTICQGKGHADEGDFFIMRDDNGWKLREGHAGSAMFNSCMLVKHIIRTIWERNSHVVGDIAPGSMGFKICSLPVDDDKNKDVYALIKKKS
jgi:hypothetical protein